MSLWTSNLIVRKITGNRIFRACFGELRDFCRQPLYWIETENQIRAMRRSAGFARAIRGGGKSLGKGLIVNLSDSICWAQLHSLISIGLRMEGWEMDVLTDPVYSRANRVFRNYGLDSHVFWSGYEADAEEKCRCEAAKKEFLAGDLDFQTVKEWRYRDCSIGGQILSSVGRKIMKGFPDPRDPEIRGYIEEYLSLSLETVHRAERLLEELRPDAIFVIEANYAFFGVIIDVAIKMGIDVVQVIQPSRDDALILKRLTRETRRIHPASVSPESMETITKAGWTDSMEGRLSAEFRNRYGDAWVLQKRNQIDVAEMSRSQLVEHLDLDPGKKIAVIFSHILWDANLFYGEDLFEDYGDWLVQTVKAAIANPQLNWLVKLHPANVWKRAYQSVEQELAEVELLREKLGDLPPHVKLLLPDCGISTWSLFEAIDYGITVRGTPGMEMPCLGIRSLTAGTGRYSGLGFTDDFECADDYLAALAALNEREQMNDSEVLKAKQHAFAAFCVRPWCFRSFEAKFRILEKGAHPLHQYFELKAQSLDDVRENGDLESWSSWVTRSKKVDYLDTEVLEALSKEASAIVVEGK